MDDDLMRPTITFEVFMVPVPKARPRMTKTGHVYTPAKTAEAEKAIQLSFIASCGRSKRLEGPVSLTLNFIIPRPKTNKNTHPVSRPDLDNYAKTVMDALNGLAFHDDSQVVHLSASKHYVEEGDRPRILVHAVALCQ